MGISHTHAYIHTNEINAFHFVVTTTTMTTSTFLNSNAMKMSGSEIESRRGSGQQRYEGTEKVEERKRKNER